MNGNGEERSGRCRAGKNLNLGISDRLQMRPRVHGRSNEAAALQALRRRPLNGLVAGLALLRDKHLNRCAILIHPFRINEARLTKGFIDLIRNPS
jgi:hypothetical protein